MQYKNFYAELGKLLYAVAEIDGVITQKEKQKLYDIVMKELVPAEKHKDEFGTDVAYYTGMEFEHSRYENVDPETAFNSFLDFVEEHQTAFDEKLQKVCLYVVKELANAYHKTNKKEKILIGNLKKKIEEIKTKQKTH